VVDWEWQLQISRDDLLSTLSSMGKTLLMDPLIMGCTLFYIFVLPFSRSYFGNGQHYEKNKPFWKKFMATYNYVMSVYSLVTFILCSYALARNPLHSSDCELLMRNPLFYGVTLVFYWSKIVEYLDSFFLYVRGVPVSYLHWFHHIGAAFTLRLGLNYEAEPLWIFVWLNSFVHTIMYWYYASSVIRTKEKGIMDILKPYITVIQIIQFNCGFYYVWPYPRRVPCFKADPFQMLGVYYFTWFYVGIVLLLFLNFFIQTYMCSSKKRSKETVPASPRTPVKAPDFDPKEAKAEIGKRPRMDGKGKRSKNE